MKQLTREKAVLEKELEIFRSFHQIDTRFPLQYIICLYHIALKPGISPTALSKQTNIKLSTISRIIGALSTDRQKGKAYNLIKVKTAPGQRREKQLYIAK